MKIPFNKPCITGNEMVYIRSVFDSRRFAGNGAFSQKCARWLEKITGCKKVVLVPSGTAALEMMMLLAGIGPGDEVIMPSFTFSSTANAVVLRGAIPVFIDIRRDTLNMDELLIEAAITSRTKAILPVHYAGVGCEMDTIMRIAKQHGLLVLEDAAQCILSFYNERHLGTFGQMSAISFHETKNIHCGEGGALLINDPTYVERAEILMEKGTDRSKFFRGEIDKYSWVDVGSSFLMNEVTAAFLLAQLEESYNITEQRRLLWDNYFNALGPFEAAGILRRPIIPDECIRHNAHIFYVLLKSARHRDKLMTELKKREIFSVFHYIPLDSSPAGRLFSLKQQTLSVTEDLSAKLLRLPLHQGLPIHNVLSAIKSILQQD